MNYSRMLKNAVLGVFCIISPYVASSKNVVADNEGTVQNLNKAGSLAFLENNGRITNGKGTSRNDIDFSVNAGKLNVFVGGAAIHYQWARPLIDDMKQDKEAPPPEELFKMQQTIINAPIATYRLDVKLIGANTDAVLVTGARQSYYEKFYLPGKQDEVKAYTYDKITYKNVYPNIDWVLYTKNNQLKYDFVVHPGGDINDIKIQYNGAKDIQLVNGQLFVTTPYGEITEQAPYSYNGETKEEIRSNFKLDGNVLSFDIENPSPELVIDPFLDWATYHGGSSYDWGSSVTTDYLGNVYLAGWTYSGNNIATSGAFQDTLTQHAYNNYYYYNGYVAKFNSKGVKQWGTYYPGFFNATVCDGLGYLYLTGWVDSIPSIATPGCHQDTFGGRDNQYYTYWGNDAFIVKFNTSGSRVWGTFYGGNSWDYGSAITYDPAGYIYVGGTSNSKNNIATKNSHLDTLPNSSQYYYAYYSSGWLAKFSTAGVRQWATYYRGMVTSICVDNSGYVDFAGTTFDTIGIATTGSYQPIIAGWFGSGNANSADAYIARFNSAGVRQWGTYYGGQQWDWISGIDNDEQDNIYITGSTYSDIWLATSGAHQTKIAGGYDAHLAKFSPSGSRLWATYYGGTYTEWGSSVKVSPLGKVYINGTTGSKSGIATQGAVKDTLSGGYDIYVAEFSTSGTQLWGTYYGGPSYEYNWGGYGGGGGWGNSGSHSLDASVAGKIYVGSATYSDTGIATPGAHQTQHGGNYYDGFLVAFVVDTLPYVKHPFIDTVHCVGDTMKIPYGVTYSFQPGNIFTLQLSDANGDFGSPKNIGTVTDTGEGTITCVIPNTVTTGTGYRVRVVGSNPVRVSADNQIDMKIFNPPSPLTTTNNGPVCVGDAISLSVSHPSASGVSYKWTGPNSYTSTTQNPTKTTSATLADTGDYIIEVSVGGCSNFDTTNVVVNIIPEVPTASSNSPVCPATTLNLFAVSTTQGVKYNWTGPLGWTDTVQYPSRNNTTTLYAGTYYVTATREGCTSAKDSAVVAVAITTSTPTASSNSPVCEGQDVDLISNTINNATYNWTGPNGFNKSTTNTVANVFSANSNAVGTYYVTATVNGCTSLADSVSVEVNKAPHIGIYPSPGDSICVGGSVTFVAIGANGGNNPQFQWHQNGIPIPGANTKTYSTANLASGDIFMCTYTSTTTCTSPATDTSIYITMTVRPIVKPEVSITVDPGKTVKEGELVTFTAHPVYGGKKPKFQWKRNGNNVQGATGNIWGTYQVNDGDVISVEMISDDPCTQPKDAASNEIKLTVLLGVDDISELAGVSLYPNPNNGTFTLKGSIGDIAGELQIDVINALGQLVYHDVAATNNGELNKVISLNNQLSSGIYMLRLSDGETQRTIRFTLNK